MIYRPPRREFLKLMGIAGIVGLRFLINPKTVFADGEKVRYDINVRTAMTGEDGEVYGVDGADIELYWSHRPLDMDVLPPSLERFPKDFHRIDIGRKVTAPGMIGNDSYVEGRTKKVSTNGLANVFFVDRPIESGEKRIYTLAARYRDPSTGQEYIGLESFEFESGTLRLMEITSSNIPDIPLIPREKWERTLKDYGIQFHND